MDPEFARLAGFERPIMHGLCTHGFACRALIGALVPGQPEKVRRLSCRFTRPLYPGIPIRTLIWKTGDGSACWRTINADTGETVIDRGEFDYGDAPGEDGHMRRTGSGAADKVSPHAASTAGFSSVPAVFAAMPDAFVAEAAAGVDVVFQFVIAGAGDWHCTVRENRCMVMSGRHSNPTLTLDMNAHDFLDMINGRLQSITAFTQGRLKIEGDVMQAPLFETLFRLH